MPRDIDLMKLTDELRADAVSRGGTDDICLRTKGGRIWVKHRQPDGKLKATDPTPEEQAVIDAHDPTPLPDPRLAIIDGMSMNTGDKIKLKSLFGLD